MFLGSILRNQLIRIFEFRLFFETADHYVLFRLSKMADSLEKKVEIQKSEKVDFLELVGRTLLPSYYKLLFQKNVGD